MLEFNAANPTETLGLLDRTLSSLTICKSKPLSLLHGFVYALMDGELRAASEKYRELTSCLLTCGARRTSGNIWRDHILDVVLMQDDPFAAAAAAGRQDDALFAAMRSDLALLGRLFTLDDELLLGVARERAREAAAKGRAPSDTASAIATAAWGGGAVHHVPNEYRPPASIPAFKYPFRWSWGDPGVNDSYCADEALEGMYRRFTEVPNWETLTEDLWNFHASYGSGSFLKYRNFCFDGRLSPMPDLRPGDFVPVAENEYGRLLGNAIAFMRDECAKPMLLCGGHGMGKTTMMLELTDELPRLRLVYVTGGHGRLAELFETLRRQPLKFMVLLDDLRAEQLDGVCEPMLPMNVLLAACADAGLRSGLFEVTVELPSCQLNEFIRVVAGLLAAKHIELPTEVIRSACVDYQVDTHCEFNIASAVRIAELLQS